MAETDDLPSLKSELERKVVDYLETIAHKMTSSTMERQDVAFVANAIWHVTSGLVDNSISNLCTVAADGLQPRKVQRHLVGKGVWITVTWTTLADGYAVRTVNTQTGETSTKVKLSEPGTLRDDLRELFTMLLKGGFIAVEDKRND